MTKETELKEEIEALYQFCKWNKEAVDRLHRISSLIKQSEEKESNHEVVSKSMQQEGR